jgi:hypothetical protein
MNFFQFHLPSRADIDGAQSVRCQWRRAKNADPTYTTAFEKLGNKGWNWETLKAYYKKAERLLPPDVKGDVTSFDLQEHGLEGALRLVFLLHIYSILA